MVTAVKSKTNGKAEDVSIDDLSHQINILKADIANLTTSIGAFGKSKAEETALKAQVTASDLKDTGLEAGLKAQENAVEFIRTQPATALGIAAGLGFLVGMATAKR